MLKFVNREQELAALDRACGAQPGLAVVSGRRRVGKTALLDHFARGRKRALFLPGTRAPVGEALRRLEDRVLALGPPVPGDLLDLGRLDTWDAALGYLLARAGEEPLLLVLDEFPYLCEADPALPSTLQARWDHRGDAQLSIVLAGSHVALMEELLGADAPLFGRADAHLRLQPFSWREAGLLAGGGDPDAWLEASVTVGGMPRYLHLWDPRLDALANLSRLLDGPGAPLSDEGTVVLQEVSPASAASRVLELVALGADTFGAVRERSGLAAATVSEALSHLEGLGLVDRITPAGADPRRTKRVRYALRDPLLAIWLAVVQPNREAFELGRGEDVLTARRDLVARIQQQAFTRIAQDWLGAKTQATCGPWWPTTGGAAVDALALRGDHAVAAAAVHWAGGVDGAEVTEALHATLASSPFGVPPELFVVARAGDGVVTPHDLLADVSAAEFRRQVR